VRIERVAVRQLWNAAQPFRIRALLRANEKSSGSSLLAASGL
jgi:hypothetical protein